MSAEQLAVSWDEYQNLMDRYQLAENGRFKAERALQLLKAEVNGSQSKEAKRVRAVFDYHDEHWKTFNPRAKGLKYPMDGADGKVVRKALRWGFSVDDLKQVIDAAFSSDHHTKNKNWLTLESILRDEHRIRKHIDRLTEQKAQALMDEGLRLVKDTLHPVIEAPLDRFLKALEAKGVKWRASRWGDEGFSAFLWFASCPSCEGVLRVTENVAGGVLPDCQRCNLVEILEPLWLVPSDLWTAAPVELQVAA